jgi:hypothetical protein
MIEPSTLSNRGPASLRPVESLTDRERDVVRLVNAYVSVAQELPSAGWLSRRLAISRERARELMQSVREKSEKRRPVSSKD